MEVILLNNRAFPWYNDGKVFAKGYLYDTKNRLFQGEDITGYFYDIGNEEEFRKKVREANGSFLVIVQWEGGYYVAVDRLRSMLLFVANKDDQSYISDDAPRLREKLVLGEDDLDPLKVEELCQSRFTVGSTTIYRSIAQLRGGEYAVVSDAGYQIRYYYEHTHGNFFDISREEAFHMLDNISERMFRRLVDSVHGRQIVVPLSGGYDSRYIVAWLKKLGYDNVCCFTYGRPDSFEVRTSRQVAEKLGYEWHFVEYTPETWASIFMDEWKPFYSYSGQLSQTPHLQDIYAVKRLLDQGIIQKNGVVVPGYCGDGLGGSYVVSAENIEHLTPRALAEYLSRRCFTALYGSSMYEDMIEDAQSVLSSQDVSTPDLYNSVSEAWFTINRWSKFVVNALRGYDYFGLEWRMPLWDNELMDFWYRVPNAHREYSTWYDGYLLEGIFKEQGIEFRKPESRPLGLAPGMFSFLRGIKRGLRLALPEAVLDGLQQKLFPITPKDDFNQFSSVYQSIGDKVHAHDRARIRNKANPNTILTLWYLQEVAGIH